MTVVEVFADITCPFAHVGLKRVAAHVAPRRDPVDVYVRAWPLEWVNGAPLDVEGVRTKARALTEQLGIDDFSGLRADRWPDTTIPALELSSVAYRSGPDIGLAVSLAVRAALFEHGQDIGDPDVLAMIAAQHGITPGDLAAARPLIEAEYDDGRRRGVSGSPHFWIGQDGFFCPSLVLDRDTEGHLVAHFDADGLAKFLARLDA